MISKIKRGLKKLKKNRKKLLISEIAALVVLCTICAVPGVAALFAHQTDTVKNQFNIIKPKPIMVSGKTFRNTIPSTATSIVFSDEAAPADASLTDVSAAQNKSVVAWIDGTTYKVSTQTVGERAIANPDSSGMFGTTGGNSTDAYRNLTAVDVQKLDTSIVTNMSGMFYFAGYNASTFTIEGLSGWDTSQVTNMSHMFAYTGYNANTWNIGDLSSWNTSKVTDLSNMFFFAGYNSSTFTIEGLSGWNTSKVTDMSKMFYSAGYKAGTWNIGNLSGWDTSQVTAMSDMFYSAGYKASTWNIGDLSSWDTSQVTAMSYMFYSAGYSASTFSIGDLSGWNTSQVTSISGMFYSAGYSASTFSIGDLGNWDTSQVTKMSYMFYYAGRSASTFSIGDLSSWDTSQVTVMSYMFRNTPVTSLNLSSFDTSKVTNMDSMFIGCTKLEKVTLGDKFAWVGTDGYLPAPSSTYIDGADGKWYNEDTGTGYAPEDIPSNTAATYVAVDPNKVKIVSWADGTDEEIVAMVAAADAGKINLADYWSVGDERQVTLSAMDARGEASESHAEQTVTLVLMHQGGYKLADGSTCNFVVGQKNGLAETGYMNSADTNSGSWDRCARRAWCNSTYYNAYPETLKPIFKQFKTITAETYNGTTRKTSVDYFALPAEKEIFGSVTYSNTTEGNALTQFDYYKTSANRIKKQGDNGSADDWWERSPSSYYPICFCRVSSVGSKDYARVSVGLLLAPFGCI